MKFHAKNVFRFIAVAASVAIAGAGIAQAQGKSVTLRFEHFLPASSNAQAKVIEPWCADLDKASNGRIKCEIYPSMQLGGKPAQLADLVRNGVVDIVWTALGYSAGSFPRSELLDLPFMLPYDGMVASPIIYDYATTYAKDDFKDYRLLAIYSDVGGVIHTTKKEIKTVDDLKGVRLRASTRQASEFLTSVGATPVSMPPSQIADSLSKGVLDGALASWEVVPPTKLDETTSFHTQTADDQAATVLTTLAVLMNKQSYDRMPDDLKKIFDEYTAGKKLTMRFAESWDKAVKEAVEATAKMPDQHILTWDNDTYLQLKKLSQPVVDDWLKSTKGGIDRKALYDNLEKLVKEQAPNIVR